MARRSFPQKRTFKPEKMVTGIDVAFGKDKSVETSLRANNGIWRKMNDENGTCDVKVLRRGLNVQG
jgi:hypothetical protein